jgi:hypothetical protein
MVEPIIQYSIIEDELFLKILFQRITDLDNLLINGSNRFGNVINEITARLEADDDDLHIMPRSRDFPIDGHILFKRLKKEDLLI